LIAIERRLHIMLVLIAGLVLFLGVHSTRIVADGWRAERIQRLGEGKWKGLYSLLSIVGLAMIVWGYGLARADPIVLWQPPLWTRHLAALLTLPVFVLIAAAYIPGTHMKQALGHPMLIGIKLWAAAHLVANGTVADVILFGAFLAWAIFDFKAARGRDRAAAVRYPAGSAARDLIAIVVGLAIWVLFAFHLHGWLIGVRPFA
jgi:uncharacterized membrane protein